MCYSNPLPTEINCTVERLRLKVPRLTMLLVDGWQYFWCTEWFWGWDLISELYSPLLDYCNGVPNLEPSVTLLYRLGIYSCHNFWYKMSNTWYDGSLTTVSPHNTLGPQKALYYGQMPFLEIDMRHPGSGYIVTHHDKLWWVS